MHIILNGAPRECRSGLTVDELLSEELCSSHQKVAVEINGVVVPKSRHMEVALNEGDRIEFVSAIGGG